MHPPIVCLFSDWIPALAGSHMSTVQAMACALMACAHVMHIIWVMRVIFLYVQTTAATAMESATMKCIAVTVRKGIKVCSFLNFCCGCHITYNLHSSFFCLLMEVIKAYMVWQISGLKCFCAVAGKMGESAFVGSCDHITQDFYMKLSLGFCLFLFVSLFLRNWLMEEFLLLL